MDPQQRQGLCNPSVWSSWTGGGTYSGVGAARPTIRRSHSTHAAIRPPPVQPLQVKGPKGFALGGALGREADRRGQRACDFLRFSFSPGLDRRADPFRRLFSRPLGELEVPRSVETSLARRFSKLDPAGCQKITASEPWPCCLHPIASGPARTVDYAAAKLVAESRISADMRCPFVIAPQTPAACPGRTHQ